MRVIFTSLVSYLVGIGSYILTLKLVWNQTLAGDATAVLFWGAIAFFTIASPLYLLVIKFVDKLFGRYKCLYYP